MPAYMRVYIHTLTHTLIHIHIYLSIHERICIEGELEFLLVPSSETLYVLSLGGSWS